MHLKMRNVQQMLAISFLEIPVAQKTNTCFLCFKLSISNRELTLTFKKYKISPEICKYFEKEKKPCLVSFHRNYVTFRMRLFVLM